MKKKLIVSVIALLLATFLGANADLLTPYIEKAYCRIQPEECK